MPAGVAEVDRVAVAVGIGLFPKRRVPRQEAPERRVIVTIPHLLERVRQRQARRRKVLRPVARTRVPLERVGRAWLRERSALA